MIFHWLHHWERSFRERKHLHRRELVTSMIVSVVDVLQSEEPLPFSLATKASTVGLEL